MAKKSTISEGTITSLEQAKAHAKGDMHRSDFIVVTTDGSIYLCKGPSHMEAIKAAYPDSFQVKPEAPESVTT